MRFLDIFQAFPTLILAMAFCAIFGSGVDKCIWALGITGIPGFARLMRANILRIVNMEYIEAARPINSSLSFLGMGVQEPKPEWGAMLSQARDFMRDYPHMVIIPGLFIVVTVLSFNLIGDAFRDALDPKFKD